MTSIQTRPSWQRLRIRGGCAVTATVMLMCAAAVAGRPPGASAQTGGVRLYEAPMASSAPVIDGDLSEEAWRDAPWTESFVDIRGEDWPSPVWTTRAKITWDAHCLYIGAKLEEPHLWATLAERDAIIYRDHDFEVFIDPDGDGLAYYELEINALGTEFDLFLDRPYSRGGRAYIEWDMAGLQTAVRLDGTLNDPSDEDAGWTVEIAIPWSALRPPVEAVAEGRGCTGHRRNRWRDGPTGERSLRECRGGRRAQPGRRVAGEFLPGAVAARHRERRLPEGTGTRGLERSSGRQLGLVAAGRNRHASARDVGRGTLRDGDAGSELSGLGRVGPYALGRACHRVKEERLK